MMFVSFNHTPLLFGAIEVFGILEEFFHIRVKCSLVSLEGKEVVGFGLNDGDGNLALGSHCIKAYNGSLEIEKAQELGHRFDLIALLVNGLLSKSQTVESGPRADDLDGALVGFAAATECFPVNGNEPTAQLRADCFHKNGETICEDHRIDLSENPEEGIAARNPTEGDERDGAKGMSGRVSGIGILDNIEHIQTFRQATV